MRALVIEPERYGADGDYVDVDVRTQFGREEPSVVNTVLELTPPIAVDLQRAPQAVTVRIGGEADVASAKYLASMFDRLLGAGDLDIEVDASRLEFVDVAVMRVVADAARAARQAGRSFRITDASQFVARVLRLTGLAVLRRAT